MAEPKRVVIISDTHFGSAGALLPPKFQTSENIVQPLNIGQQYLWKCWVDFCERVKDFKPDAVIHDGDAVEGTQPKEGGMGLSLRLMTDQKHAAVEGFNILKDACPKGTPFFFVQGTKYHVGENGDAEEEIAGLLGAREYPSIGSGRLVKEVLWLDVDGVIIEVSHSIGGNSGFYRTTALDREMQWSALSAKDRSKGVPKSDLVVRAHLHYFMVAEHASKQGLIVPCWQLQTKYARKASVHRMHPDIGGIFVYVDAKAKKRGEPPCRIIKQLYDLPPVPITKL